MTTKKEFIAKILEVGKGKPIDTSMFGQTIVEDEWIFSDELDILLFRHEHLDIIIYDIKKTNPPKKEADIGFRYEKDRKKTHIDTIPDDVAEDIIKQLYAPYAKPTSVELTYSAKEAIHGLQKDIEDIEWGGGIDFEIIKGRPQIERIIAHYAEKGAVPSRIIRKYENDVEMSFHTHPHQALAVPSKADINCFINSKQQVDIIAAGEEIVILEKTRNTPKTVTEKEVSSELPAKWYQPENKSEQLKKLKEIEQKFKIRSTIIPYTEEKTVLDLNVIRNLQK
jgi:proteasome lid subunit RPN8/RPN11